MDKILNNVNFPDDIKILSYKELRELAKEIREYMIKITSKNGGHVAPSLGAVEIAIAIHYVFDAPKDKIVWDVGHQAYAHKILTGRKDALKTLRQFNGISGFNNIFESEYDNLTVGHAATSLSASLGMAIARDMKNEDYSIVNIIGDGSMTNGLVYEAMNNIAQLHPKMIIVLNDNKMSISENVGGISLYLNKLQNTQIYTSFKKEVWELLGVLPDHMSRKSRDIARRMKESLKNFFVPTILFEEFGIRYIGPIDGHNIEQLIETLKSAKKYDGPIVIHAITLKGKGYTPAENDPTKFHGLGKYNSETGKAEKSPNGKTKYTNVFGKTLTEIAKNNKDIVAITAAMPDGTGLSFFRDTLPDRFFDVGIAEGHAVLFSVGLALNGLKPVCAIYSTFLQRSYDQLIHDASLMKQNVFFVLDRAGIVGDDGPTHHGLFDLSYLRTVPEMVIMAPKDEDELRSMIKLGIDYKDGPIALRYPRGEVIGVDISKHIKEIKLGQSEIIQKGERVLIIAIGSEVYPAIEASKILENKTKIKSTIVNARFVRPFDENTILSLIKKHDIIVTAEENILSGGFGEMINSIITKNNLDKKAINIGINDVFVDMGKQEQLRKMYKIDADGIFNRIYKEIQ